MDVNALRTARMNLREADAADAAFLFDLMNEPGWLRHIGDRNIRTHEDAAAYVENVLRDLYRRLGYGLWVMERRVDGERLGLCGLLKRDSLPGVDLGFAVLRAHHRRGLAEEAARASVAFGFETLGLAEILAVVSPANRASRRLLEKMGFVERGETTLRPEEAAMRLYALQRTGGGDP